MPKKLTSLAMAFALILGSIPPSFAADTTPPSAPTSLTATAISSSQINLSWTASTDNVGVTGYKIYRCAGSTCAPTTQIATSATNSYSDTGLIASTAYTYNVSAYDAAGNDSGKSASASATTQASSSTLTPFPCDYNSGSGTTWPGWTWYPKGGTGADGYGSPGWQRNDADSYWRMPRSHLKNDTGNDDLAEIVTIDRAPSTSSGGSLKVYDTGKSTAYNAGWWWLHKNNFGTMGYADSTTNRMSFYFKPSGMNDPLLESSDPDGNDMHVGTYLCWPGGGYGDGADCPKEASNQHYYHFLTVHNDAWLRVVLDRHPQHQRGIGPRPIDNPASPYNYYQYMNSFYVQIRYPQQNLTSYLIDEMQFSTAQQPENDISISSVWTGYWTATDKWEIGFNDSSFGGSYNDYSGSTFEIRYSSTPITNENFSLATPIRPEYHQVENSNLIRRPNTWKSVTWTRFQLPDEFEVANNHIYFAIKDVSVQGGHVGAWPYQNGDGHDAPSPYIKTIDYYLRPDNEMPDTQVPTVPSDLTATAVSSSQINLSWTASTDDIGVVGYKIYRCTGSTCTPTTQIGTSATNSYSDTGLTASTAYTYTVSAYDAAGNESNQSSPANATTLATSLTSGIVAHWKLDEGSGATAQDASGNNNTGTLTNGPAWTASGKYGGAISFDGINDKVSIPSSFDIPSLPFTVGAWIYPVNYSDWHAIFSKRSAWTASSMRFDVGLEITTGKVYLAYAPSLLYFSYAPPLNVWTHVAIVANAANTQLYINGNLQQTSGNITLGTGSAANVAIGNTGDDDDPFAGRIDDVRIYNRALSQAEIQADMNSGVGEIPSPDTLSPSIPTSLSAAPVSSSQINLSWTASTDNVGVTGYKIYRCSGSGCAPITQIATSATNSYSDTGLTASTAYTYTVSAYDATGNSSAQSSVASTTTQAALPGTPPSAASVYSFDDMTPNANSNALPQSSANWRYELNGNLDKWISNVTGDAIQRYQFDAPGNNHMGFPWYGFLEIDSQAAIKGNGLKINVTGGYNSTYTSGKGLKIENKAQYLANIEPFTNAVIGTPYLYFRGQGFYPNNNPVAVPFSAASNATALTLYAKAPAGDSVDGGGGYPGGTWQLGPYSKCTTCGDSGHFYNTFYAVLDGWVKLQVDNAADWNNGGYRPIGSIPGYVQNIHGFYFTYGSYEGQFMTPHSYWLDEIQFETDTYAPQNQETLYDLAVGYEPSSNTWQVGFTDKYGNNSGGAMSSYQVRYSFSPITNENWANAAPAHILTYPNFGLEARTDGSFQKPHTYAYRGVWAKFRLASAADDAAFQASKHIYFAVKDISQNPANLRQINPSLTGAMAGQGRDYNGNPSLYTDYARDVNNLPYIKRIDYILPGASTTSPPADTTAPSVPTGVTTTVVSSSQINLSWTVSTDNVGVTGYKIYRDGVLVTNHQSPVTNYSDTGLTASTTYTYTVSAYDAAGNESAKSSAVLAATKAPADTTPPARPRGFRIK